MKITNVYARQILDSRATPTVECSLQLDHKVFVSASVPAGASVGKHEATELRDGDQSHYRGKGVLKVVSLLETDVAKRLVGRAPDVIAMDKELIDLDGTANKSNLGANTLLAASMAVIRAQAVVAGVELFKLINQLWGFENPKMPLCLFNVINGGMHAQSGLAFQEFMIVPQSLSYKQNLEAVVIIYQDLKKRLDSLGLATSVGDEGGFAPRFDKKGLDKEKEALEFLRASIEAYQNVNTSIDIGLALDVAATCLFDEKVGKYVIHGKSLSSLELVDLYYDLIQRYPIASIEDGLGEDDWDGWQQLTNRIGSSVQIVGDDLFTTNIDRIKQGVDKSAANAVLIKPNQIGTVTETIQAIQASKAAGFGVVISHRSGETNDSFIADLAVGSAAGQIKAGAPVRGERVAKYNRLLEIEARL